jgi:hypothetical protein
LTECSNGSNSGCWRILARRHTSFVARAIFIAPPTPPTPDELVLSTIHREKPDEEKPNEEPIVVVMTGLDESRVRRFAAGQHGAIAEVSTTPREKAKSATTKSRIGH